MNTAQSNDQTLAILGFHKIGEPPANGWDTWFYIAEATFVNYMEYLRENEWQVIDAAAFLNGLIEPSSLPKRAALLTFDDGYRSMRETTLPLLIEPARIEGQRDPGSQPREPLVGHR